MKYEYTLHILPIGKNEITIINEYGSDGWELVSILLTAHTKEFYFKRPIIEDPKIETG